MCSEGGGLTTNQEGISADPLQSFIGTIVTSSDIK